MVSDAGAAAVDLDVVGCCPTLLWIAVLGLLVFRNRRGYAPVLLCYDCGWHADCPRCDRPMTLHAGRRRLICHHCENSMAVPTACPSCASANISPQGQGTERLEVGHPEVVGQRTSDLVG